MLAGRMNSWLLGSLYVAAATALTLSNESRTRFAIVQPIFHGELQYLKFSEALKCKREPHPLDLVIYFSGGKDDTVPPDNKPVGTFEAHFKKPMFGACFQSIVWKYGNISRDMKYPKAPSEQFFAMLAAKPAMWGYDAIFQMELDMLPLHVDWVGRIFPLLMAAGEGHAWVIGGTYDLDCMDLDRDKCNNDVGLGFSINGSRHKHINGNAVYTSRGDFIEWALPLRQRQDVQRGYDFFMFKYLLQDVDAGNDGKYHRTPMIMDCKPVGGTGGGETKGTQYLKKNFPDAVLVHSQFLENKKSTHLTVRDLAGTKTMVATC